MSKRENLSNFRKREGGGVVKFAKNLHQIKLSKQTKGMCELGRLTLARLPASIKIDEVFTRK